MELVQMISSNLIKKSDNLYLTKTYTSNANNSYHSAISISSGLMVKEDIGIGYLHTFLNRLEIYSVKDKKMIVDKNYHCFIYSKLSVIGEISNLLMKILKKSLINEKVNFNEVEVKKQIMQIATKIYEEKNLKG